MGVSPAAEELGGCSHTWDPTSPPWPLSKPTARHVCAQTPQPVGRTSQELESEMRAVRPFTRGSVLRTQVATVLGWGVSGDRPGVCPGACHPPHCAPDVLRGKRPQASLSRPSNVTPRPCSVPRWGIIKTVCSRWKQTPPPSRGAAYMSAACNVSHVPEGLKQSGSSRRGHGRRPVPHGWAPKAGGAVPPSWGTAGAPGWAGEQLCLPAPSPRSGLRGQILVETLKPQAQQLHAQRSRFGGLAPLKDVGRATRDMEMVSVR